MTLGVVPMPVGVNTEIELLEKMKYRKLDGENFEVKYSEHISDLYSIALYGRNYDQDIK
jgi:hypothetical protein